MYKVRCTTILKYYKLQFKNIFSLDLNIPKYQIQTGQVNVLLGLDSNLTYNICIMFHKVELCWIGCLGSEYILVTKGITQCHLTLNQAVRSLNGTFRTTFEKACG